MNQSPFPGESPTDALSRSSSSRARFGDPRPQTNGSIPPFPCAASAPKGSGDHRRRDAPTLRAALSPQNPGASARGGSGASNDTRPARVRTRVSGAWAVSDRDLRFSSGSTNSVGFVSFSESLSKPSDTSSVPYTRSSPAPPQLPLEEHKSRDKRRAEMQPLLACRERLLPSQFRLSRLVHWRILSCLRETGRWNRGEIGVV